MLRDVACDIPEDLFLFQTDCLALAVDPTLSERHSESITRAFELESKQSFDRDERR